MRRLRWTAFILVAVSYMLAFFHRMAPAAIASDLQQAFDASAAALGGLAATYFYVYTVMQIPTGILVDTLGARRDLDFLYWGRGRGRRAPHQHAFCCWPGRGCGIGCRRSGCFYIE